MMKGAAMHQGLKNMMMSLICFMSYGKWQYRTAYDCIYRGQNNSRLLERIIKDVFGEEVPEDAAPMSFVTLSDLKRMAGLLALKPGACLADIACGRGGPGMWIARKTGTCLTGVDVSEEAVDAARKRIQSFGLASRAVFNCGSFYHTGLPASSCDGAICVDALWLAPDRGRALRELNRILKPGAKFVFTNWDGNIPFLPETHVTDLEDAGFEIEIYEETKGWKERQLSVYKRILQYSDALIDEMGQAHAMPLIKEARSTPPVLEKSTRILVSARKVSPSTGGRSQPVT
ncbi:MAG: methyltransferase domain-containing protein [Desulfobacter sp.]|nr:MAG: methyltransferase domain-containing protein [Desulfobacter sp.]